MKRILCACVIAVIGMFNIAASCSDDSGSPGHVEKIVFVSDTDGANRDIYSMNPDGSGRTRLTDDPDLDCDPAMSYDGSKIVFVSERDGGDSEIYVMNADGTGQTRLTDNDAGDHYPTFSPDGARIVFTSDGDICVMDADGTNETYLTNSASMFEGMAQFSPDGTIIVYAGYMTDDEERNIDIFTMNADGSDSLKLTDNPDVDYSPRFSPDGAKIVFSSERGGSDDIYVMNTDGTGQTNLTNDPSMLHLYPCWSPDGEKIAFTSVVAETNSQIYVMDADGENPVNISNNEYRDLLPDWR